jgi:DNA-binding transcriptional LysR family regulator
VRLLDRTKRQVQLTHAGMAFLEDARKTIAHAEMAAERARLAGRGERGVLRIGFIAPAVYNLLPGPYGRTGHASRGSGCA